MNKMYHALFTQEEKEQILALPNFDVKIFKETTGRGKKIRQSSRNN